MNLLDANDTAGQYPQSYYAAHANPLPPFPSAKGKIRTDVCVVGAGFTGLSAALHLAQAGYSVTLVEAQRIGFGASGRNGGQVGTGQRQDQDELEKMVGLDHAKSLWGIAQEAVQLVKDLSGDMTDCSVVPGVIHAAHKARFVGHEHDYADKLARDYGYDQITTLDRTEMRAAVASPKYFGGTLDMGAGHIDPLRYALGLARKCIAAGVKIYEDSRVKSVTHGTPAILNTDKVTITADHVLLACNGYLGDLDGQVASHVMPINNFILATEPMDTSAQEEIIASNRAVADSKFVVNYFRFSDDHRLLFGGAETYGYRFPRDIPALVRKPMLDIFPQLVDTRIDYAWGGTLAITMNRMPYFARLSGNILSASGYSGHGVAMATLGGKMMAQALAGQAEQFDMMAAVPTPRFPGGVRLRSPLLVLAMLWFSLRDKL